MSKRKTNRNTTNRKKINRRLLESLVFKHKNHKNIEDLPRQD